MFVFKCRKMLYIIFFWIFLKACFKWLKKKKKLEEQVGFKKKIWRNKWPLISDMINWQILVLTYGFNWL